MNPSDGLVYWHIEHSDCMTFLVSDYISRGESPLICSSSDALSTKTYWVLWTPF